MWKVREVIDQVTNVVMNYTEIESKVREATSDEPWGPTGTQKHELSQATFSYDQFPEVMGMLWKRISENKRFPRRIYKSLLLLHFLILNGSDRVIRACQDRLYEIRCLLDYHIPAYDPTFNLNTIISGTTDVQSKESEVNVRVKAKEIVDLLQDDDRLKEERKKCRKNRDKYVGISSDKMSFSSSKWGATDDGFYDRDLRERDDEDRYSDRKNDFKSSYSFNKNNSSPEPKGGEFDEDSPPPRKSNNKDKVLNKSPGGGDSEFGDFAQFSSSSSTSNSNNNNNNPTSKTIKNNSMGEFADFKAAFPSSDGSSPEQNPSGKKIDEPTEDLLGAFDEFASIRANSPDAMASLSFPPAPASSNVATTMTTPLPQSNTQLLMGLPGTVPPQFQQAMPNSNFRPQFFNSPPSPSMPGINPGPFGGASMGMNPQHGQGPLLQPQLLTPAPSAIKPSQGSSSNHPPSLLELKRLQLNGIDPSKNEGVGDSNKLENNPLKNTTWGDLGVDLTSLSLNKKK